MMPKKLIEARRPSALRMCPKPITFDNRGFPVEVCGQVVDLWCSDRCVMESCRAGHTLSMRPVADVDEWDVFGWTLGL